MHTRQGLWCLVSPPDSFGTGSLAIARLGVSRPRGPSVSAIQCWAYRCAQSGLAFYVSVISCLCYVILGSILRHLRLYSHLSSSKRYFSSVGIKF